MKKRAKILVNLFNRPLINFQVVLFSDLDLNSNIGK